MLFDIDFTNRCNFINDFFDMSTVIFSRCDNYNLAGLETILRDMFESAGFRDTIKSGERILLKPNLLSAHLPQAAVTTHPAVLEAVSRIVLEMGAIPIIGDSPGGILRKTETVFHRTGTADVASKMGIPIVPLDTQGIEISILSDGEELHITRFLDDIDGIINIAKLKTHSLMLTTLAVKNLYGLVPGFRKSEYHKIYPSPKYFAWLIAEIYERVRSKLRLSVIDGIIGMDGNGPSAGRARELDLLAVSDNAAAMDIAIEDIIGLKRDSPLTLELKKRGLVPQFQKKWLGEPIEHIAEFKIPFNWHTYLAPQWLARIAGRLIQVYPGVDMKKCIKCGECMESCPVFAISMTGEKSIPEFDYRKCVRCMCCHEICPVNAVVFKKSLLAKLIPH